jgi:hypothetical protein
MKQYTDAELAEVREAAAARRRLKAARAARMTGYPPLRRDTGKTFKPNGAREVARRLRQAARE